MSHPKTAPTPPGSSPTAASLLLFLTLPYLFWNAVAATALFAIGMDEINMALLVWAVLGASLGFPFSILLAVAGASAEGRLHRCRPPQRMLWLPMGWGIALGAHWLPTCVWPVLLVGAAVLDPGRADDYLGGALWSLSTWIVVGVSVVIVVVARQSLDGRSWRTTKPLASGGLRVPPSVVVAAGYVLSSGAAGLVLVGWLSNTGWEGGGGLPAVIAWLFAGVAIAAAAGGAQGVWSRWASHPRLEGGRGSVSTLGEEALAPGQMEVAGALFVAHWIPPYLLALAPDLIAIEDLRWLLIFFAFAAGLAGTALWSVARVVVRSPVAE